VADKNLLEQSFTHNLYTVAIFHHIQSFHLNPIKLQQDTSFLLRFSLAEHCHHQFIRLVLTPSVHVKNTCRLCEILSVSMCEAESLPQSSLLSNHNSVVSPELRRIYSLSAEVISNWKKRMFDLTMNNTQRKIQLDPDILPTNTHSYLRTNILQILHSQKTEFEWCSSQIDFVCGLLQCPSTSTGRVSDRERARRRRASSDKYAISSEGQYTVHLDLLLDRQKKVR
jgi:hypothetical protein